MQALIGLSAKFTVSQMLEREEFLTSASRPSRPSVSTSSSIPLAQGYDSVASNCDVELGGTDQKFNLLMGRELQRDYGQKPQIVLMTPILEGLDGVQKMSKSLGNAIGINEPPAEMYGKLMSINDELMWKYWVFLTDLKQSEIDAMQADVKAGNLHPMEVKKRLARTITAGFHGEAAAASRRRKLGPHVPAERKPPKTSEESLPMQPRRRRRSRTKSDSPAQAPRAHGPCASGAEANRKIAEKAVKLDGEVAEGLLIPCFLPARIVVRLGKRAKVAMIS